MPDPTTIQIEREDRKRLEALKLHPAQPVHEIVRMLLDEHERLMDLRQQALEATFK